MYVRPAALKAGTAISARIVGLSSQDVLTRRVLSICHGGIWRVSTRSRIALAQGRTFSYVTSYIGAIESGLWQAWHFSCNMGATSLVKVIVVFADSALENCGHEIRMASANALRNLKVEPFKGPPLSCTPAVGAVYDRALFLQSTKYARS